MSIIVLLILLLLKSTVWQRCELVQYGRVDNNSVLKLTARNVLAAYVWYIERVNDFDIALSPPITIFGRGVPIINPAGGVKGKKCWDECGRKGGHCPHVCGAGGFCCRAGFNGCPSNISADSIPKGYHTCVTSHGVGKDCNVTHLITKDHFQLKIIFADKIHDEYHYTFPPNKFAEWGIAPTPPQQQLNIMVVLVDTLSHSHTRRSMPKTYAYLQQHSRWVGFDSPYNSPLLPFWRKNFIGNIFWINFYWLIVQLI